MTPDLAAVAAATKLHVRWNLAGLATTLARHLEGLRRADQLWDTSIQSEEFLEAYDLTPDDEYTVTQLAWRSNCLDCGSVFDHYMVFDHIWAQAGLAAPDYCCRSCLAKRLGRALGPA